MDKRNETSGADFILLGLFLDMKHIRFFIGAMLVIYTVALTLNFVLILLICVDSHLHMPMYFLLSQLALMDMMLISSTVPKMATNFFSGRRNVSRVACGTQFFFFLTLGIAECILITLMSYDRYVAICNPLRCPHHEPEGLSADGCHLLGWGRPYITHTHGLHHAFPHLWFQRDFPFPL